MSSPRIAPHPSGFGAYGLRLSGLKEAEGMLVQAASDWPRFRVARKLGAVPAGPDVMSERRARLKLQNGGEISIDREDSLVTFLIPHVVDYEEIVHPLLAPVGAVVSYWLGRESFHGGAFISGSSAWVLLGDRGAGKSTIVGWLALAGCEILCDDLLVLDGQTAFAGPRSVDLRRETAEQLEAGEALGLVGARERWRLRLPQVSPTVELAGWIFLEWGDSVECVPVGAGERLRRLHAHRGIRVPARDPTALIELSRLPGWVLKRPRRMTALEESVQCLLATVD